MFEDVYHVAYQTDDLEAAKAVYLEMFDGTVEQEAVLRDGTRVAFLRVGKVGVELVEPADKARLGGQTGLVLHHVGYQVDDLDATIERLKAKGMAFATERPSTNPEGARLIYPAAASVLGARIHLTERPVK
jgi:methylmalonyl-CoA/ethylmalonyl-CoA epimerase